MNSFEIVLILETQINELSQCAMLQFDINFLFSNIYSKLNIIINDSLINEFYFELNIIKMIFSIKA